MFKNIRKFTKTLENVRKCLERPKPLKISKIFKREMDGGGEGEARPAAAAAALQSHRGRGTAALLTWIKTRM